MFLLTVQLGLIETVVFSCALVLLIGTIYFVSNTIKGLRFIKEEQKRKARHMIGTYNEDALIQKSSRLLIGNLFKGHSKRSKVTRREADLHVALTRGRRDGETIDSVTDSIMLHKQQLDNLSQKVERLRNEQAPVVVKSDAAELQNKIDRLELLLEEKDEALLKLRHDNGIIEMMTSKLEEAQRESDSIQERLPELEKQAGIATKLILDLDEVREDYTQLQKEQQHNQEKLREVLSENARLHQQLYETDDKLQEAKLERQQLMKRARLIEELNTDFQSVSDNNFKMKSELRRVGELESMLNMMTEERDRLLHRGNIRAV
ncbi:MAG TPA: hypothetical protein VEY06_08765 [Flavisolibacter sp.]|nr:hypothetical protein [Flavisolibacter sp.]